MKTLIIKDRMEEYLAVSKYINRDEKTIMSKADEFKQRFSDEISLIKAVYEFVHCTGISQAGNCVTYFGFTGA